MDPILLDAIEYNGGGITTLLNRGAVKSVQRGSGQLFNATSVKKQKLSISPVNLEKSVLIISFFGAFVSAGVSIYMTAFADLTDSETIILNYYNTCPNKYGAIGYTWTVIEFY